MNRKLRWCKFHEDVFVKGFGNAGNEIDAHANSSRYRKISLSGDNLGVHLELVSNTGGVYLGFAPWTMVKFATFLPDETPPTSSNKKVA